ncbi:MAG TPA: hypothetical protein VNQ33_00935, partial [Acidimicrobiales bacterium]|nr:hypothetical protein [Acidimicrobiales bacterium]
VAAGLLAQLPVLCLLDAVDATVWQAQLAVVAQAFAVLVVTDRVEVGRWVRRVAAAWAVTIAALFTAATTLDSTVGRLFTDAVADLHRGPTGLCLAAAALLAGHVAWLRAESDEIRTLSLVSATALGLAAMWFGSVDAVGSQTALGLVAVAAALVMLAGRQAPTEWRGAPVITAGVIGGVAVLPLLGAVASMLVAASAVSAETWHRSGATVAADLQLEEAVDYGARSLALQLTAVAVGVVALVRRSARVAIGTSAAVVAVLALVLSPLLVPLTITATVLIAVAAVAVGVAAAFGTGARTPGFVVATGFAVAAYAWATPWSLATPGLTLLTLSVGIAGALVVAAIARRDEAVQAAGAATAWVVAATPLLVGLAVWEGGVSTAMSWALAATAAAVLSVVGVVLLDPKGTGPAPARVMARTAEATALVGYLGGLLGAVGSADPNAASVALAAGVIGFGLQALRPGRLAAGAAAAVELLALVWLQLDQAGVVTVEAYTLPLAAVLLAAGLVGARLHRAEDGEPASWVTCGPALVVAFAPTVWLSFVEPGSLRPLVGLVAGALVLVGGAVWGKRALVDVGAAAVIALGLQQIAPVVGEVPNWATIGATGILLLAVGATFEQRRRDVKAVLRSYSALT